MVIQSASGCDVNRLHAWSKEVHFWFDGSTKCDASDKFRCVAIAKLRDDGYVAMCSGMLRFPLTDHRVLESEFCFLERWLDEHLLKPITIGPKEEQIVGMIMSDAEFTQEMGREIARRKGTCFSGKSDLLEVFRG